MKSDDLYAEGYIRQGVYPTAHEAKRVGEGIKKASSPVHKAKFKVSKQPDGQYVLWLRQQSGRAGKAFG